MSQISAGNLLPLRDCAQLLAESSPERWKFVEEGERWWLFTAGSDSVCWMYCSTDAGTWYFLGPLLGEHAYRMNWELSPGKGPVLLQVANLVCELITNVSEKQKER